MAQLKVSFITTVFNEAGTIGWLLDSLASQSQLPDEAVIIDAGSTDATAQLITDHPVRKKLNLRLITAPGCNRSQARNLAVKQAKHKLISVSDAGCRLDPDWLKRIIEPFRASAVESVAGFYQTETQTGLQQAIAPFLAVMPDRFNPKTYLPSSRSLAFRKTAWKKVAGYPENLDFCEDLVFSRKLKTQTHLVTKPEAIVYWQLPRDLRAFYTQVKNYASGDIEALYWPHLKKILTVFGRYLIFLGIPPLFLVYLFWPAVKFGRYQQHPLSWVYLPVVQITADLAVMRGALAGLKQRLAKLI